MGAAQTKTNATQNEVNIIIIKIDDRVTKVDLSPKLTSLLRWPLTKVDLSPKFTSHQSWPLTKVDISPKLTSLLGWHLTKVDLSPKFPSHQSWPLTKVDLSPKLTSLLRWSSPKLTSHQNLPLTKVDLSPRLTSLHTAGDREARWEAAKHQLVEVWAGEGIQVGLDQFFNDLGSQTTRDITAEIELLMVEKRRLEYGIQVIWQS